MVSNFFFNNSSHYKGFSARTLSALRQNYNIVSNACRLSGNMLMSGYNKISSFSPFPISIDTNNYIYDKRGSSSSGYWSQLTTMITSSITRFFGGIKDMILAIMYKPEAAQAKTEAPAKPEKKEEDTQKKAELDAKSKAESEANIKLAEAVKAKADAAKAEAEAEKAKAEAEKAKAEAEKAKARQVNKPAKTEEAQQPSKAEKTEQEKVIEEEPSKPIVERTNFDDIKNKEHKKLLEKAKRKLEVAQKLLSFVPKAEERWFDGIPGFKSDRMKALTLISDYRTNMEELVKFSKKQDSMDDETFLRYMEGSGNYLFNYQNKIDSNIIDDIKNLIPEGQQGEAKKIIKEANLGN